MFRFECCKLLQGSWACCRRQNSRSRVLLRHARLPRRCVPSEKRGSELYTTTGKIEFVTTWTAQVYTQTNKRSIFKITVGTSQPAHTFRLDRWWLTQESYEKHLLIKRRDITVDVFKLKTATNFSYGQRCLVESTRIFFFKVETQFKGDKKAWTIQIYCKLCNASNLSIDKTVDAFFRKKYY